MISEKDIPEGWELKPVSEVCDKISLNKIKIKQKDYLPKGLYPIVDQGQEKIGGYYNDKNLLVPETPPYIVFGDHTKVRKFINFKFIAGADGVKVLKSKSFIQPEFFFHALNAINIVDKGYARHYQHVEKELIPIPPKEEQQRIVEKIEELFSEVDKGIETLQNALQQLKTYRQSVLKHAFEGKLTHPEVIDGELPEGWEWVKLETLGELARGKSKHRPRNDKKLFGGKYPFIQTGEVKAAKEVIREYSTTYSETGLSQSKLWPKDTLCITIAANIAETAFLGFDACFPDSIVGFTANTNLINPKFIFFFLKANKSEIDAFAPATAQKNINLNTLENLIIPYCQLSEQQQIVSEIESRLSLADKLEENITHSLQQAHSLKQSILKKAFEGKLVTATKPHKAPAVDYFKQVQVVAATLLAIKKTGKIIPEGEMVFAKGLYLIDRIYGVNTGLNYKRWHLGPYAPELKKIINNKQYFIKPTNGQTWLSLKNIDTVLKYNNSELGKVENAVSSLNAIFQKYSASEKSHKIELLATVCKVIEDIQSTDIDAVWQSMESWEINLPKSVFTTKAQKFTKEETSNCINFIVKKEWDKKLMTTKK